jgi:hypothetical protein
MHINQSIKVSLQRYSNSLMKRIKKEKKNLQMASKIKNTFRKSNKTMTIRMFQK